MDEAEENRLRRLLGRVPRLDPEPDHAVIRVPADWPAFVRRYWDGRWIDLARVVPSIERFAGGIVARPTGRFEFREDGACAEVWEMSRE